MKHKENQSYTHKIAIVDYLKELEKEGWKTINLKGKSPDGIAVKDGKVVAVEVMTYKKHSSRKYLTNQKKSDYFMFDDVLIRFIERINIDFPLELNSIRVDPAYKGIHIVDVANGGERIYIAYKDLIEFRNDLIEAIKSRNIKV